MIPHTVPRDAQRIDPVPMDPTRVSLTHAIAQYKLAGGQDDWMVLVSPEWAIPMSGLLFPETNYTVCGFMPHNSWAVAGPTGGVIYSEGA